MAGSEPERQRELAEALGCQAWHDHQAQSDPGATEIDRSAVCGRLAKQLMQSLLARAVIRQIGTMVDTESTEDLSKPAPLIDDSGLHGRHEGERRGRLNAVEKRLRRTAGSDQAKPKRPCPKSPSWRPLAPAIAHARSRLAHRPDHPAAQDGGHLQHLEAGGDVAERAVEDAALAMPALADHWHHDALDPRGQPVRPWLSRAR
jgi:hypothetical protein